MKQAYQSKVIWIFVAIVIVGVAALAYMYSGNRYEALKGQRYGDPTDSVNQASAGINEVEQELQAIEVEGLDAALDDIEKEIAQ